MRSGDPFTSAFGDSLNNGNGQSLASSTRHSSCNDGRHRLNTISTNSGGGVVSQTCIEYEEPIPEVPRQSGISNPGLDGSRAARVRGSQDDRRSLGAQIPEPQPCFSRRRGPGRTAGLAL